MGCGVSSTASGALSTAGSHIAIKETGGFKLAEGDLVLAMIRRGSCATH
jgi:hypothetical protein